MKRLIIIMHGLGDNIMATPAMKELKKQHPEDDLYIGGFSYLSSKEVWEGNKDIKGYIEYPIDYHPTYWNHEMFNLEIPKIEETIHKKNKELGLDFKHIIMLTLQNNKNLHRTYRIGRELGITVKDKWYDTYSTEGDKKIAETFLKGKKVFIVHRGGGNYKKSWDLDECKETTEKIKKLTGLTPFIIDSEKEDTEEGKKLEIKGAIYLSNLPKKSIGVTKEIMKLAKFGIFTDSFPMHLACSVFLPLVSIFTMTNIHETAPINTKSVMIVTSKYFQTCPSDIIENRYDKILIREYLEDYRKVGVKRVIQGLKLLKVINNG